MKSLGVTDIRVQGIVLALLLIKLSQSFDSREFNYLSLLEPATTPQLDKCDG